METTNCSTSTCRYCRHYKLEGRRGGSCQMLSVPVESNWQACVLAAPPFENPLINLEDILQLETSFLELSLPPEIPQTSVVMQPTKAS